MASQRGNAVSVVGSVGVPIRVGPVLHVNVYDIVCMYYLVFLFLLFVTLFLLFCYYFLSMQQTRKKDTNNDSNNDVHKK